MSNITAFATITGILIFIMVFAFVFGMSNVSMVNFGSYTAYIGLDSFPTTPTGNNIFDWTAYIILVIVGILRAIIGTVVYIINAIIGFFVVVISVFATLPALFNILFILPLTLIWLYLTIALVRGS